MSRYRTSWRRAAAVVLTLLSAGGASAADATIERGAYLVALGGCAHCHTPGAFLGRPDFKRLLGGSDVGFAVPNAGVFYGPNLTPDDATGLGTWTPQQIVAAVTTGRRPDGRQLMPAMPYPAFANLSADDAMAIALYLKSLPPVRNKVQGPFGPNDRPTGFVMTVLPPEAYNALPKPPAR